MKEGEKDGAGGGNRGPALGSQDLLQGEKTAGFGECVLVQAGHQDDGQYNLIGWQAQEKGHEDHTVQTEKGGEGMKDIGTERQQAAASCRDIGHEPDEDSRRDGGSQSTAHDKECPIQDGAD